MVQYKLQGLSKVFWRAHRPSNCGILRLFFIKYGCDVCLIDEILEDVCFVILHTYLPLFCDGFMHSQNNQGDGTALVAETADKCLLHYLFSTTNFIANFQR